MNSKRNFTNNSWKSFNWLLAALALALIVPARAGTQPAAIPISDIGARATANYRGYALGVTATADGARLRCGFQKLEGHATPEGLWLESTKPGAAGRFRLVAVTVGRGGSRARQSSLTETASSGRSGMSVATVPQGDQAPSGAPYTHGAASFFEMPLLMELETTFSDVPFYRHAAPNGAIPCPSQGTQTLARTGTVSVDDKLVRFTRPGLTEEYSVSVDGVRQDFIIVSPPLNPPPSAVLLRRTGQRSTLNQSAGDLRVELALSGARAEVAAGGARLSLDGSGRTLTYSRLRVVDATGRELTARLEVLSANRLAVSVADANATYPVRIDPTFSDADWVSLGSGMNGTVAALAVSGTNLYAGGHFTLAGLLPANNIAKWDGRAWSALGLGMTGDSYTWVSALLVSGSNLYAAGSFTTAGGAPANRIAKWDGSTWSALGSGLDGKGWALAVSGTKLYVGGDFTFAGGARVNGIAQWDGSAWSALGSGVSTYEGMGLGSVYALAVSGTNLYAGGLFTKAGEVAANYIAKWDGNAWSVVGAGLDNTVGALVLSGTNLYAGGHFSTEGYIAKWDGSAWSALGSGMNDTVAALAIIGPDLCAGGYGFTTAGGIAAKSIARWDGNGWSALGSGMNNYVYALAADGMGHLFVGGMFTLAGTNGCRYIAQANVASVPAILRPPRTQTAEMGATVDFAVTVPGGELTYQLFFNGTNLLCCGTDSCLELTNVDSSQSGAYTVVITNFLGAATSSPAMLNVIPPVARRWVPGVNLMAQAGNFLGLDYRDDLGPTGNWETMATMTLSNASQFYFDLSEPLPPQRYYRAWQTGTPGVVPSLSLPGMVPAITLTGSIGHSVRLDYINQFGPIDAWVTLATVPLTNTSQLYFDTSSIGQPARLYRVVQMP